MKKLALAISFMLTAMGLNAITVTRYVSPDGTGNGMTPETPTSDIAAMLAIGSKVDGLNLKVAPGVYSIKSTSSDWSSIKNVVFDGTWNNEGTEDKVRISTKDISFANCNIKNVSFSGDLVLHGGNLIDCESDKIITIDINDADANIINCKAAGFRAEAWSRKNSKLFLKDCKTTGNTGYGLWGKGLGRLIAFGCDFSNNQEGGANIDGCRKAEFIKCSFSFNSGDGALNFVEFDNSGTLYFDKCEFLYNNVTSNHCNNLYIYSNVTFYDCLFIRNAEKDYDNKGFLHLSRPDFKIVNCTFIGNKGALDLESFYPSKEQIINCLFYDNGPINIYAGGREDVPLLRCAMDQGTGIPELDAEKGIILLTPQNKGFEINGTEIKLEPNSILINNGVDQRSYFDYDINYHPRRIFGGTDIGCTEFISSPGLWKPDSLTIDTYMGTYRLAKASMGSDNYYCLVPEFVVEGDNINIPSHLKDIIYLDKMPVKPKVFNNQMMIERHKNYGSGYIAEVLAFNTDYGIWSTTIFDKYTSAKDRPIVQITEDQKVKFVKPQSKAKTPAKKATKSASKSASVKGKRSGRR